MSSETYSIEDQNAYKTFRMNSNDKILVDPKAFLQYLNDGEMPDISFVKNVIFLYDNSLPRELKQIFKAKEIRGFTSECYLIEDNVLICFGFGIGSPAAAAAMEELIAAGANRFISFGTAGGISPGMKLGDIVICTSALIDEGTSHHYIPEGKYSFPHTGLTNELYNCIKQQFNTTTKGISWTTDAPFRESYETVANYQNEGISTVEMEASSLFTVGKFRNVEVASLFVIGDLLTSEGWQPGFRKKKVKTTCSQVLESIVKYCHTL